MTDVAEELDLRDVVGIESWVNPQWKDELQRDPNGAMRALAEKYGLTIPDGMEFRVHEDSDQVYNLVLSPSPAGFSPAENESEVQGFLQQFGSISGGTEVGSGTSAGWFCNKAICSATSTRCYSHCISAG